MAAKGVQVITVEPAADNVKWLQNNLRINGFEDRVQVVSKALGSNNDEVVYLRLKDIAVLCMPPTKSICSCKRKGYLPPCNKSWYHDVLCSNFLKASNFLIFDY
jgi:hypothetical protein